MLSEALRSEKNKMIQRVLVALDALPDRLHAQNSFQAAQKLLRMPEFGRAKMLGIFVGYGGEVDTVRLMEAALSLGKRVAAPATDAQKKRLLWREVKDPVADIDLGPLGLPEPQARCHEADVAQFDIVIIPGLLWDEQGRRMALWPGYFERSIRLMPHAFKLGLAFEMQIVEDLSRFVETVLVDSLVTEDQVRRFGLSIESKPERRLPGGPKGYKG